MDHHDVGDPGAPWPNNVISRHAIVYDSGVIGWRGEAAGHEIDPNELELCRRLSTEVAQLMAGIEVGMGSCSSDPFRDFFIMGLLGEPPSMVIDEMLIRSRFDGTIFPPTTITVEPLAEEGIWWSEVETYYDDDESKEACLTPWRTMIRWFRECPEFVSTAFVRIGDDSEMWQVPVEEWPPGTELPGGCVFPRLPLGLTKGGSLVGLFGYSVQA